MSAYDNIVDRIQDLIQATSTFAGITSNVTIHDWRVMDRGITICAVIYPGEVSEERKKPEHNFRTYAVNIDILSRIQDTEKDAWDDLMDARADIITMSDIYPSLNHLAGVTESYISADEPQFIFQKDQVGPVWIKQTLTMQVTYRTIFTTGEYA